MKKYISRLLKIQNEYFKNYVDEISIRNIHLIRIVGLMIFCIFIAYYVVTVAFFDDVAISKWYGLIAPIMMGFYIYGTKAMKAEQKNSKDVLSVTLLLYIVVMGYSIILSVFPHPEVPSVFFHVFLIAAPVIFVLPVVEQISVSAGGMALFTALVLLVKSPDCWHHELFEAATSFVCCLIVIGFMTQYRVQSDALKSKYYELSQEDMLTGTLNKVSGQKAAMRYLNLKLEDEKFAILFIDIDDFKNINDTYGHIEGDKILQSLGTLLKQVCRENDIVCRFGGDEFMILLKGIKCTDIVAKKAQKIVDAVSNYSNGDINISCSIGVVVGEGDNNSFNELIKLADESLYDAKRQGKSCYVIFNRDEN